MKPKLRDGQGFSLIEMMIVAAVIAILGSVAVPQYRNYIKQGHVLEMKAFLNGIVQDATVYAARKGRYPATFDQLATVNPKYANNREDIDRIRINDYYTANIRRPCRAWSSEITVNDCMETWAEGPDNTWPRYMADTIGRSDER